MDLKIYEPSADVLSMGIDWAVVDALMGGTKTMRQAGDKLMPVWTNEAHTNYSNRLNTATLYPAFNRTVGVMSGKPFSKELTLEVPEPIEKLKDDIDAQGTSLHVFAGRIAQEAIAYGLGGILVDFTRTADANGQTPRTRADERAVSARPYWVHIKHDQILGWRSELNAAGIRRLSQLRLAEAVEVPDGDYGTKMIKRVRVLTPGRFDLYEDRESTLQYTFLEGGPMAPQTEIPFVPFYGKQLGFMVATSPLMDLAYLNVKHWQSQSDQDTILHIARVPILAIIGGDEERKITVSSSMAVNLSMGAEMKYVEHTGQAIGAGQESLTALEQQMIQTGAELLIAKPGQRTATEANNDAEGNKSDLQRIVENLEDSLDRCLQFTAQWLRSTEGGHASLFKDFGVFSLSDATAQIVLAMRSAGLISKKTAVAEMQRRGVVSPDIDLDLELEQAEKDGPDLGVMVPDDGEDDPDKEV